MNLEVGELVMVLKEEPFPADLIFLKCSEKNGIAFVDTMNLDGEVKLHRCHHFFITNIFIWEDKFNGKNGFC